MNKIKKNVFILLIFVFMSVSFSIAKLNAEEPTSGSLTIICLEHNNGDSTSNLPLKGVEYTLYKVSNTCEDVESANTYVENNSISGVVKTTDDNGQIVYDTLEFGRYYVKVTDYPNGTSKVPESFLVDVPKTNATGDGFDYNITVKPKIETATGKVVLTKIDGISGSKISDVEFKVQYSTQNQDGTWSNWNDYVQNGTTLKLTTGTDGKITFQNYPITYEGKKVRFRFYELRGSAIVNTDLNYIINNKELDYFYLQNDGKTIVVHFDGTEEEPVIEGQITAVNYIPGLIKTAKTDDGNYNSSASVGVWEKISYKIETDVPEIIADMATYNITDTFGAAIVNRENVVVIGRIGSTDNILTEGDEYTQTLDDSTLAINFIPTKLVGYDKIIITYDASMDVNTATIGSSGYYSKNNINTAKLKYTSEIDENGVEKTTYTTSSIANIFTAGLAIYKVDTQDNPLKDAVFKIASTEENAKAGVFLKDATGNDLIAQTGEDGYAYIYGLALSDEGGVYYNDASKISKSYYLVEIQAPTYEEEVDGVVVNKPYDLLKNPLEVTVDGSSHTTKKAVKIVNKKPLELPLTGGIGIVLFVIVGIVMMATSKVINKRQLNKDTNI